MSEPKQEVGPGAAPSPVWPVETPATVPPEEARAEMTNWFDPKLLLQTGLEVAISSVLGRHADPRLREGLGQGTETPYDYTRDERGEPVEDFWLDYASDVGDGWNSTYAVAYHLAQPTLTLGGTETRRGSILLFGGDEVYPYASRPEYERRTLAPYQTALPRTDAPHPHLFAIPGNHDWYDSLVAFTRFFTARQWFGGWRPQQRRSYFALRLPHGWWLLGTDVQLASDIDAPQVEFFKGVAAQMGPDDRVILCNAEPYWIQEKHYSQFDTAYADNNLKFLEHRVLGRRVSVFIAGDSHHYRRHEDAEGRQKVTAGGGGAFLHPTHGGDVAELAGGFKLASSFPDERTSRRLTWKTLDFGRLNPSFGMLTALLYVFIGWMLRPTRWADDFLAPLGLLRGVLRHVLEMPVAGLTLLGVFGLFWLTTDTHSKSYKWKAGGLHALAHLSAIFLAGWGTSALSAGLAPGVGGGWFAPGSMSQLLASGVGIFLAGLFVAPRVMGLYLLVSLNRFGRHSNEAFSALKIEDWKHFLRLHINREGHLTLYPVGIERVPRQWKPREGEQTPSLLVPDDARATAPQLIEPPIRISHAHGSTTPGA
ncbi:metallophosphoesterase [Myxococcaceae bacterium GXIMD 01537]